MAELREVNGDRSCVLEPEHLVGRGSQCALRLTPSYVSAQHAVIRWNGRAWELIDRGSRNGTRVNGEPVEAGRSHKLARGAVIAFGDPKELWRLAEAGEPEVMVVALDSGGALLASDGIIALPSSDEPVCTIYRDVESRWKLEMADGSVVVLEDGATFSVAARTYRFRCPFSLDATAAVVRPDAPAPALCFTVSSDEEFVELSLEYPHRTVKLGSRSHNYLLLTLARARLADRDAGVPEASCGWTDKEQLADDLRVAPPQVDGEIFRIRKHFIERCRDEAALVIERRPRTKQIRLGFPSIRITKA